MLQLSSLSCWKKVILLLIATLFLSGCVAHLVVKRDQELPPQTGFMVVQVVSNSSDPEFIWEKLSVWSVQEKKVYYVSREEARGLGDGEMSSTSYFAIALQPGIYWLDSISYTHSTHSLGYTYRNTYTATLHDKLSKFEIKAGQATNLGTIIYVPKDSLMYSKRYFILHENNANEFKALLKHKYPQVAQQVLSRPLLGWERMPAEVANKKLVRAMKKHLARLNPFYEATNGEIYSGSRLGQIYVRSKNGRWRNIDTGITREILSVAVASDGRIYAAGERVLLYSDNHGRSWRELPLPDQGGRIEFISLSPREELYLLMMVNGRPLSNDFELYRRNARHDTWQLRTTETINHGVVHGVMPIYHVWHGSSLGFGVNDRFVWTNSSDDELEQKHMMNLRSGRFLSDGTMYAIGQTSFTLSVNKSYSIKFYDSEKDESYNVGEWNTKDKYVLVDTVFIDKDRGYVLLRENYRDAKLLYTSDRGKTWETRPMMAIDVDYLYLSSNGTLLTKTTMGYVYSSRNKGRTWTRERDPLTVAR